MAFFVGQSRRLADLKHRLTLFAQVRLSPTLPDLILRSITRGPWRDLKSVTASSLASRDILPS